MSVETSAELQAFFDVNEFGVLATLTLVSGGSLVVNGIFEDPWEEPVLDGIDLTTVAPTFRCRSDDLTGVAKGDAVAVVGRSFTIRRQHPDGTGITLLLLQEV